MDHLSLLWAVLSLPGLIAGIYLWGRLIGIRDHQVVNPNAEPEDLKFIRHAARREGLRLAKQSIVTVALVVVPMMFDSVLREGHDYAIFNARSFILALISWLMFFDSVLEVRQLDQELRLDSWDEFRKGLSKIFPYFWRKP